MKRFVFLFLLFVGMMLTMGCVQQQQEPQKQSEVGRYQLISRGNGNGVFDTATGCFYKADDSGVFGKFVLFACPPKK